MMIIAQFVNISCSKPLTKKHQCSCFTITKERWEPSKSLCLERLYVPWDQVLRSNQLGCPQSAHTRLERERERVCTWDCGLHSVAASTIVFASPGMQATARRSPWEMVSWRRKVEQGFLFLTSPPRWISLACSRCWRRGIRLSDALFLSILLFVPTRKRFGWRVLIWNCVDTRHAGILFLAFLFISRNRPYFPSVATKWTMKFSVSALCLHVHVMLMRCKPKLALEPVNPLFSRERLLKCHG